MILPPTDLTFVVRECGERTAEACVTLLQRTFPAQVIHRVSARPFSATLRLSLEKGLSQGRPWLLCIDADVLLLPEVIDFITEARRLPSDIFVAQALIIDKLLPARRPAGNHLYRTELIPMALPLIPNETVLRPEAEMIHAMCTKGFLLHQSRHTIGLHDFEQWPADIFAKAHLHAHKHRSLSSDYVEIWKMRAREDNDYAIALAAWQEARDDDGAPPASRDYTDALLLTRGKTFQTKPPLTVLSQDEIAALLSKATTLDPQIHNRCLHLQAAIDAAVFSPPHEATLTHNRPNLRERGHQLLRTLHLLPGNGAVHNTQPMFSSQHFVKTPAQRAKTPAQRMPTTAVRPVIVFLGHDATRTGAPKSLLAIVRWFSINTAFKIVVLLNRGGPLHSQYLHIAETYVWNTDHESQFSFSPLSQFGNKLHRLNVLLKLQRLLPVCIFNNTGTNGHLVKMLKITTRATVISRIPELEAFMRRNAVSGSLRNILEYSDQFIAVSEAVRNNLSSRHNVSRDKIFVTYGACVDNRKHIPSGALRRRIDASESEIIVCGCGTMDWRKGFDLFVHAAYTVCQRRQRNDIKFVWIGAPMSDHRQIELEYEIELLGLVDNLYCIGEIEEPSKCFADANLFFLSSREDPFPLVMLEAAQQALPIICFDKSGGATEFVDSEIGLVVPILDIEAASDAIIGLADDNELARRKGSAAASRASAYTIDRMCNDIYACIDGIVPH